jgi:uncharacterized protein (TIGR03437 family)
VTVAAGATTGSFTATAGTVTANQAVTITASLNSSSVTASVTVTPPATTVTGLSCTPASVASGGSTSCTVTISQVAPTGGTAVTLSDTSTALTTPASVTVAAGATTGSFTATAGTVTTNQSVTVTASLNGTSKTASVTVTPPATTVTGLSCTPTSVASGGSTSCTVTISQAAPTGGTAVTLSDNSTALTPPASVTVAAGATTGSFTATAGTVTANQAVTVTATLNASSVTASVTVMPPASTTPAAAYAFDEGTGSTTADASGNGNTGQLVGATWTKKGEHGNALSFNGNNNYVDVGAGPSFQGTGSMTWSAWIYATGNPSDDGNIIAKSAWGSGQVGWQFKTTPDTGSQTFGILISADGSSYTERCSKTVRALNTWYFVAAVYNASAKTLDIYVNGVLNNGVLYGTIPGSQYSPSLHATVGKRSDGFYFKGTIDDLRVYNRALSASEIQNDMNTAVTALKPAMVTSNLPPSVAAAQPTVASTAAPSGKMSALSFRRNSVATLSCSPRTVNAGAQATCELQMTGSGAAAIQLASSSGQVNVPVMVATRANQSRLAFQATVDPAAREQAVTVTATLGGAAVQDTIQIVPSSAPLLRVPGKQFARFGERLTFQVTGVDPTELPVQVTAADVPGGAYFDPLSGTFQWTPTATQRGDYRVTFTATNVAQRTASAEVTIDVDSGAPVLSGDGLACSPGAIGTLNGKWLADSTNADPSGGALELGGTGVKVNGRAVPVLFASATRVTFMCPTVEPGTPLSIAVQAGSVESNPVNVSMQTATPQIFSLDGNQGAVTFHGSSDVAAVRGFRTAGEPAQSGDDVIIWATGIDPSAALAVNVGGMDAEVESVDAAAGRVGVYAIQVRVPAVTPGDAVPVQLTVGKTRSNTVMIAVE